MKVLSSCHSFLCSLLLSSIVGLALSGCLASKPEQPVSPLDPVVSQTEYDALKAKNGELAGELSSQKKLSAQLQMSLLEKHVEVNRLTVMNEHLIRDFVRNKSKLRNRGDKVEIVRLLAEVATLFDTVKADELTESQLVLLARADQYQAESKIELEKGNFDGASYLAGQALKEVEAIQLGGRRNGQKGGKTFIQFHLTLPMEVVKGSNVRENPTLKGKVICVLEPGRKVDAVGYSGEWVKVKLQEESNGWIHYSLLRGARK